MERDPSSSPTNVMGSSDESVEGETEQSLRCQGHGVGGEELILGRQQEVVHKNRSPKSRRFKGRRVKISRWCPWSVKPLPRGPFEWRAPADCSGHLPMKPPCPAYMA